MSIVYLDASDLLIYFHHHLQVSGIQRVQAELLADLLRRPNGSTQYVMTYRNSGSMEVLGVPKAAALVLIDYLRLGKVTRERVDQVLARLKDQAAPVDLGPEDCFFLLGAYWALPDTPLLLRRLARQRVRIGALIYDMIPIRFREFAEISLAAAFAPAAVAVGECLSFAFAISDYVARDYAAFRREKGQADIPILALPLAVEREFQAKARQPNQVLLDRIGPHFAMQVGTLEIRKNPRYALEIWRQLLAEGRDDLPKLVYVGRIGWRVTDFLEELKSTDYLDGRVLVVSGVSDADLSALYAQARFTLFPSFSEGWGLPVGESLAHGVPCITSRAASLPEVGLDFADYVDPLNVRSGVEAVKRLLDGDYRDWRAEAIRQDYPLRTWSEVAVQFDQVIGRLLPRLASAAVGSVPLPPGRMIFVGAPTGRAHPQHGDLVERVGFSQPEHWGAWSVDPRARLSFPVAVNKAMRVLLEMQVPSWLDEHEFKVKDVAGRLLFAGRTDRTGESFIIAFESEARDGWVEFVIETTSRAEPRSDESRLIYFGLVGLGYAGVDDVARRQDLVESALLGSYRVVEQVALS